MKPFHLVDLPIVSSDILKHLEPFCCFQELEYWDNVDNHFEMYSLTCDQLIHIRQETKLKTRIVNILKRVIELKRLDILQKLKIKPSEWKYVTRIWKLPATSIPILNWLYDNKQSRLITTHAIDSLETYQWYETKKLIPRNFSCWEVGIYYGNCDLMNHAKNNGHVFAIYTFSIRKAIRFAILSGYYHVIDYFMLHYSKFKKEIFEIMLTSNIPDLIMKQYIIKYEFQITHKYFHSPGQISYSLLIWLHQSKRYLVTNQDLKHLIHFQKYKEVALLIKTCNIDSYNWSLSTTTQIKYHQTDCLYEISESYRNSLLSINMNLEISSYKNWNWLLEHNIRPHYSIVRSNVPMYKYIESYDDFLRYVNEEPISESWINVLIGHLQLCFFKKYETKIYKSKQIITWLIDFILLQPVTISFSFSTWFRSFILSQTTCNPKLLRLFIRFDANKIPFDYCDIKYIMRLDYEFSTSYSSSSTFDRDEFNCGYGIEEWKAMSHYINEVYIIKILYNAEATYKPVSFFNEIFNWDSKPDFVWKIIDAISLNTHIIDQPVSRNNKRFITRMQTIMKKRKKKC